MFEQRINICLWKKFCFLLILMIFGKFRYKDFSAYRSLHSGFVYHQKCSHGNNIWEEKAISYKILNRKWFRDFEVLYFKLGLESFNLYFYTKDLQYQDPKVLHLFVANCLRGKLWNFDFWYLFDFFSEFWFFLCLDFFFFFFFFFFYFII